jgi:DNA invertase Pin-like site-specific DNA recombinase
MSNKSIKAVAYARVSTLLGQNPSNQIEPIRAFAKAREFELVNEFVDLGISGGKEKRPALDQMIKDARMGKFKVIIIGAIDRLARNLRHLLNLLNELNSYGVQVISLREQIDMTTPIGAATLSILGAVSQLEKEQISERIRIALATKRMAARVNNTDWTCGRPRKLTPDIQKRVEALRAEGISVREIASRLGISKSLAHQHIQRVQKTASKKS